MPATPKLPAISPPETRHELDALRTELRCILQHPAIAPERRQAAEPLISRCTDLLRLGQWLALAVAECGHWEEQMLAAEGVPGSTGSPPG